MFMACGAIAGGFGLITGSIDFGATVNSRLPYDSPVLAGLALFLVVAVPMSFAAVAVAAGWSGADRALQLAGLLLVGWIGVEVVVIRTYSWLQPACALWGLLVAGLGLLPRHHPHSRDDDKVLETQ